jgi:hypothetical protein
MFRRQERGPLLAALNAAKWRDGCLTSIDRFARQTFPAATESLVELDQV